KILEAESYNDGFKGNFCWFQNNAGLYGLVNRKGEIVLTPTYQYAEPFEEAVAWVGDSGFYQHQLDTYQGGVWAIFSPQGNQITSFQYEWIDSLAPGLFIFQQNGKSGIMNHEGMKILEPTFDELTKLSNRLIRTNKTEVETLPNQETVIRKFYGIIDLNGTIILPPFCSRIESFVNQGIIIYEMGGKIGLVDAMGHKISEAIYDDYQEPYQNIIPLKQKGKWGLVDRSGKVILHFQFDELSHFKSGIAAYKVNENGDLFTPKDFALPNRYLMLWSLRFCS
ncbi:MAG: WG repeat-containing protein, partial [Bacteroidia bacterium]|nr:WG repeat-containing protein [Bacteroidia bacterium]